MSKTTAPFTGRIKLSRPACGHKEPGALYVRDETSGRVFHDLRAMVPSFFAPLGKRVDQIEELPRLAIRVANCSAKTLLPHPIKGWFFGRLLLGSRLGRALWFRLAGLSSGLTLSTNADIQLSIWTDFWTGRIRCHSLCLA